MVNVSEERALSRDCECECDNQQNKRKKDNQTTTPTILQFFDEYDEPCEDRDTLAACQRIRRLGLCGRKQFTQPYCEKTCGFC